MIYCIKSKKEVFTMVISEDEQFYNAQKRNIIWYDCSWCCINVQIYARRTAVHMELNSVKRIFFISHRMGRTKSRKTAHKCSSDSSDDGGAGLIPYRTAKTFTIFVKCFDCFLLRKTAKFVVDFHYVNVCFVKKIQMEG